MASYRFITLAIVAIIVLPTVVMATQHIVGDDKGWTINVNYQDWAKDKVFHVGDTLVFNYIADNHSVFKVNGTGFNDCLVPQANLGLTTGNDTIPLKTPGNKWYICGVKRHCADHGMKLAITVQAEAPAPTPTKSSAFQITSSASQLIVAAMVFIVMIVV
ncbi:hypothetical protein LWI28_014093 [Acer negundo]|uniref:Phytocyanin domain-containing protein n=1 Tax=Acer negundo TaxID=4023 RepID=A0AAD5NVQ5_ACENE|nr:hypothetical protein LWI28_014093 [Acer negundo]KAK4852780.1 hypothetical protein QYF36_026998 [Acer negundo]